MSKFYVRTLLLCFLINPICSIVDLKSISSSFPDTPARFTNGLNGGAICGGLWLADPVDACSSLLNEVDYSHDRSATIVLIVRGNCAFDEKVRNAQEAGFQAAIVYDDHNNQKLIAMMGNSEGIWIHAVFVSSIAGEILREHAQGERVECCIISFTDETAWTVLVISIISAVAVISLLTTIFFTFYHWRNHQERRPILDDKAVADLQCVTFNSVDLKGHMGETCAICLEDYKHGENLKVLPCQHVNVGLPATILDVEARHLVTFIYLEQRGSFASPNYYLMPENYTSLLLPPLILPKWWRHVIDSMLVEREEGKEEKGSLFQKQ